MFCHFHFSSPPPYTFPCCHSCLSYTHPLINRASESVSFTDLTGSELEDLFSSLPKIKGKQGPNTHTPYPLWCPPPSTSLIFSLKTKLMMPECFLQESDVCMCGCVLRYTHKHTSTHTSDSCIYIKNKTSISTSSRRVVFLDSRYIFIAFTITGFWCIF